MREPADGDTWICRRDERIRMPYDQVIERTADGIPYGRPEIVLLFKAKAARPKDDADFLPCYRHRGESGGAGSPTHSSSSIPATPGSNGLRPRTRPRTR